MPAIEFDKKSLMIGKVVEPAWYRVVIDDVSEEPSKDGKSTNYWMEGTIIKNADNGDEANAGVGLRWNFNSKALGFAKGFFECFGITPELGKRYELNAAKGQQIEVFVENSTYEGRIQNKVNHKYRKAA